MARKGVLQQLLQELQAVQGGAPVKRHGDPLTLSGNPQFYSNFGNIFELCGDGDITTLFYEGNEPLLDWLGTRPAEAIVETRDFIGYSAPAGYTTGEYARGLPTSLCTAGAGYEWTHCDFTLNGFGHVLRSAPVRKVGGNQIPLCVRQPRFSIDGRQINNQDDWDMAHLLNAAMRDLSAGILVGNRTTDAVWDADGIGQLIKTGYTNSDGTACPLMDSTIIDWAGLSVCGNDVPAAEEATPSVGGEEFAFTNPKFYNLYYVLRAVYHRNRERLRLAGMPRLAYGDVVIVAPASLHMCLVECAVCWIECAGDYTRLDSEAANARRADFLRGDGTYMEIEFDGFRVPIIPFNPLGTGVADAAVSGGLNNADGTADMFMLFRGAGNRRFMYMQYNDLRDAERSELNGNAYRAEGNGMFLFTKSTDLYCQQMHVRTEWRLFLSAPWAQTKIENVNCESLFGDLFPISTWAAVAPTNLRTS